MPDTAQPITPQIVADHGLNEEEYAHVLTALGREPNMVELGIFSVMWSEHCSYKSSRIHLKKLPTEAPWVICGPGENAGVIDIGEGPNGTKLAAIFKMESHNHPSYIEPYQGAATGVGGILRDVFTMGARPVANLNALRFGRPDHPKMKHLVQGVVAGIGGYGNCVGVPTVGGEVNFHSAYDGNILVNAMTVGIADQDKIFYSAATGVGNPIVYVGSKTGRDGIHGATMASADFGADIEAKRPTVQVGDPFTEKLLIEACLELMASDAIVAIQDMGAAGLTSSSVEMATNGKAGIILNMDMVPCREEGMTPYEMMLSESQERMLMVLKPGREEFAKAIFDKWELDFAVIGEVTDTGHMVLTKPATSRTPSTIDVHMANRVSRVALKTCPNNDVTDRALAYSASSESGAAAPLHLSPSTTATKSALTSDRPSVAGNVARHKISERFKKYRRSATRSDCAALNTAGVTSAMMLEILSIGVDASVQAIPYSPTAAMLRRRPATAKSPSWYATQARRPIRTWRL